MITSSSNAQVKQMIQLNKKARERRKQDVFIVEGLRMFREVPRDRLVKTYVSENFLEDPEHEALLQGIPYEVVKDSVFAQMSDTLTPQGVLTVVRQYHYTMEELMGEKEHPLFLVLEDLQDPGNMGTIFRTAEGAGVDGIFMSTNCVDIYNPQNNPFYYGFCLSGTFCDRTGSSGCICMVQKAGDSFLCGTSERKRLV